MINKRKCIYCKKPFPDNTEYFYETSSYCQKCHKILSKKYGHNRFCIRKKINEKIYSDPKNTAVNQTSTRGLRFYGGQDKPEMISIYQYLMEKEEKEMKNEGLNGNWRFDFGKHKGSTFSWVAMQDYQYIEWCLDNVPRFKANYEKNKNVCDKILEKAHIKYLKNLSIRIPKSGNFNK